MKTLFQSFKITIGFCLIFFIGYVLVLWGFAAVIKPNQGEAELLTLDSKIVGAANVGQTFKDSIYFWGRPSAVDYNGGGSGGSNKGATNSDYLANVTSRIDAFLTAHPYLSRSEVPSEMVTASGSGLDPHISPQAAAVQIERVAIARKMSKKQVAEVVARNTENPIAGAPIINVLQLNIALDETN